jgi:hypothetical protein
MCVQGMVALGTELGWVVIYGFGQELKCVCGDERMGMWQYTICSNS